MSEIILNWWLKPKPVCKVLGIKTKLEQEDWQVLKVYDWGELAYDYEEGLKLSTTPENLKKVVEFVKSFHKKYNISSKNLLEGQFTGFDSDEQDFKVFIEAGLKQSKEFDFVWGL